MKERNRGVEPESLAGNEEVFRRYREGILARSHSIQVQLAKLEARRGRVFGSISLLPLAVTLLELVKHRSNLFDGEVSLCEFIDLQEGSIDFSQTLLPVEEELLNCQMDGRIEVHILYLVVHSHSLLQLGEEPALVQLFTEIQEWSHLVFSCLYLYIRCPIFLLMQLGLVELCHDVEEEVLNIDVELVDISVVDLEVWVDPHDVQDSSEGLCLQPELSVVLHRN